MRAKQNRSHDLRHQAITELAEAGAPDATLMALAGHLSRGMMGHYSHARMAAKREAVDKLSGGLMSHPGRIEKTTSDTVSLILRATRDVSLAVG